MKTNQRKHALELPWFLWLWLLQSCGIFELQALIPNVGGISQKRNLPTTLSLQPTGGSPTKLMDAFKETQAKGNMLWSHCNPFCSCKLVGVLSSKLPF